MFNKDQLETQLKSHAKSAMFERDFVFAFNKYLGEKRDGATRTYAEKKDWKDYRLQPAFQQQHAPFTVEGDDDKLHQAKWSSFLKDATFYYDLPTIHEQREMRFKLQHRYDDLFADSWSAPLQSRRDLVTWTCEQRNSYLQERNASEALIQDCKNYSALLRTYGPNYDSLKPKLGYVRGLFEGDQQ